MTIGQRIKERRKEIGMSADQLGECLGKNRSTIYRYENGDIENMSIDMLDPIANALNTTPAYLMGWDQDQIDAASEMTNDANAYSDSNEAVMKYLFEEISEMVLVPEDLKKIRQYAEMMQKADLRIIADYFYKVYELGLTEEEIKEVYEYALYIKSKRNT